jgi:transcriptional regulator with XRE-family HTH domain
LSGVVAGAGHGGEALRALREAAGVELLSLSRASGISTARLRAWEDGEAALPAEVAAHLAVVLDWIGEPRREAAP